MICFFFFFKKVICIYWGCGGVGLKLDIVNRELFLECICFQDHKVKDTLGL